MVYAEPGRHYSREEYLELDNKLTDAKYEYHDGVLVEISGVRIAHAQVEVNLLCALSDKIRRGDSEVFLGGMHISVPSFPPYRYANLSVSAGKPLFVEIGGSATLVNPALLVEIFSPETEAYDR
ncbi:MAG: Uma2 family endonuclease, partial [Blastocatellia bacterium]